MATANTEPERLLLEGRILDDPEALEAWAVYADYLQSRGDPWGERLTLGLAQRNSDDRLRAALRDYDQRMAPTLLGPALAALLEQPGYAAVIVLRRRYGLVLGARVGRRWIADPEQVYAGDARHATALLPALLSGQAARLLRALTLGHCDLDQARATLEAAGPRDSLRTLGLGWERRNDSGDVQRLPKLGDLRPLLACAPRLHSLELCAEAEGLEHPSLRQLEVEVGGDALCGEMIRSLGAAELPALRSLGLGLQPVAPGRVRPRTPPPPAQLADLLLALYENRSLAGVDTLTLSGARQLHATLALLIDAPLLSQLKTLRVLGSDTNDAVLRLVQDNAGAFTGLTRLELPTGSTNKPARKALIRRLGALSFSEG